MRKSMDTYDHLRESLGLSELGDEDLPARQAAFNVAKSLMSGRFGVKVEARTRKAAKAFFDAENKSRPIPERKKALHELINQIDLEWDAAKTAVKVLGQHRDVFMTLLPRY